MLGRGMCNCACLMPGMDWRLSHWFLALSWCALFNTDVLMHQDRGMGIPIVNGTAVVQKACMRWPTTHLKPA